MLRCALVLLCLAAPALADVDEILINKATGLYNNKDWAGARSTAQKADPDKLNTVAWRYIGGASCHLKDQPTANTAWDFFKHQVDKPSMKWMAGECAKDGYKYEPTK